MLASTKGAAMSVIIIIGAVLWLGYTPAARVAVLTHVPTVRTRIGKSGVEVKQPPNRPVYSSHECHGGELAIRTCLHKGVCYRRNSTQWVLVGNEKTPPKGPDALHYFADPTSSVVTDELTVSLRPMPFYSSVQHQVTPHVVESRIPSGAEWLPGLFMAFGGDQTPNYGHYLMGDLYPIWYSATMFGVNPGDVQVLSFEPTNIFQRKFDKLVLSEARPRVDAKWPDSALAKVTKLASSRDAPDSPPRSDWLCFEQLIMGAGELHWVWDYAAYKSQHGAVKTGHAKAVQLREFANFCIRNIGTVPASLVTSRGRPVVTVFIKDHTHMSSGGVRRQIENIDEIVETLRRQHPDWEVVTFKPETLGMREIVALIQRTWVFVGQHGGGTYDAMFLPTGAHFLVLGDSQVFDGGFDKGQKLKLDSYFGTQDALKIWMHLPGLNVRTYSFNDTAGETSLADIHSLHPIALKFDPAKVTRQVEVSLSRIRSWINATSPN